MIFQTTEKNPMLRPCVLFVLAITTMMPSSCRGLMETCSGVCNQSDCLSCEADSDCESGSCLSVDYSWNPNQDKFGSYCAQTNGKMPLGACCGHEDECEYGFCKAAAGYLDNNVYVQAGICVQYSACDGVGWRYCSVNKCDHHNDCENGFCKTIVDLNGYSQSYCNREGPGYTGSFCQEDSDCLGNCIMGGENLYSCAAVPDCTDAENCPRCMEDTDCEGTCKLMIDDVTSDSVSVCVDAATGLVATSGPCYVDDDCETGSCNTDYFSTDHSFGRCEEQIVYNNESPQYASNEEDFLDLAKDAFQVALASYFDEPDPEELDFAVESIELIQTETDQAVVIYNKDNERCYVGARGFEFDIFQDGGIDEYTNAIEDLLGGSTYHTSAVCSRYDSSSCCDFEEGTADDTFDLLDNGLLSAIDSCMQTCYTDHGGGNTHPCSLIITGHSQGGAQALVAAAHLADFDPMTITFGQPPVLMSSGQCSALIDASKTYRFVNVISDDLGDSITDIIPSMGDGGLAGKKHIGQAFYIGDDTENSKYYADGDMPTASGISFDAHWVLAYKESIEGLTTLGEGDGFRDGYACTERGQCQSNECGGNGLQIFCGADGAVNGHFPCFLDSDCISRRCAVDFTCHRKFELGEACGFDGDCESDKCVLFVCSECKGLNGQSNCGSGRYCKDIGAGKGYRCRDEKGLGEACVADGQCSTNQCGLAGAGVCQCNADSHCSGGKKCIAHVCV